MLINSLPVRHFFFFTFTSLCLKLDDPDFVCMRVCTCVCIYRRARLREIFAVWADGGEVGAPTCHFGWAALCWAAVAQRSRASYSGYPWERRAAARGQYHSVFRLYELMSLLAILSSLTHTHTHRAAVLLLHLRYNKFFPSLCPSAQPYLLFSLSFTWLAISRLFNLRAWSSREFFLVMYSMYVCLSCM